MISLGFFWESFLVVGIDCNVLVNSSPSGSIILILACHALSQSLGGLSQLIRFSINSFDSHMFPLRFIGKAPRNSTIRLNTRTSLKGLISASLAISHSPVSFTPHTDLEILSHTAIFAFLQSITALAVARNPLPTSKGVSGSFFMSSTYKTFKSFSHPMWTSISVTILAWYNGMMFTQDPKSAKVSKGLESPNMHGRVKSPGSSIRLGVLPWMNADPFLPSSKLSIHLSRIALYIGA
nr:hypothetical protein [Tanacetum cinerariifolium]